VSVIDLQGQRRTLTKEFESIQGLAWFPKGNEIWFSASDSAELNSIRAVDMGGRTRRVAAGAVRMHLQDIDEDGQLLLSAESTGRSGSAIASPVRYRIYRLSNTK